MIIYKARYNELVEKEREFDKLHQAYQTRKEIINELSLEVKKLEEEKSELNINIRKETALNIKNESTIDNLTYKIRELKYQIYNIDNYWHSFCTKAWIRDKKNNLVIRKFDIPKNFNENKVEDFDFNEDLTMCKIKYEGRIYEIPSSFLEEKYGINLINKKKDIIDTSKITCPEEVKNYIKNKGFNYEEDYWASTINFIIYLRGSTFTKKEFIIGAKIKNRESARIYINHLIKIGLIKRINKGKYKVLFNFE